MSCEGLQAHFAARRDSKLRFGKDVLNLRYHAA